MTNSIKGQGPMLALREIAKAYDGKFALATLSLEIQPGEKVAVLGPSGSGKTTLLNLLGGVIQPEVGEITIGGRALAVMGPGRELSRLVGVMPQQLDLVPHLSVVHNTLAGRLGEWSLWKSLVSLVLTRDRDLVRWALNRVGLVDKQEERTSHLSGGEQQRVAMARLLVQAPQVILADEPVASLDPARAEDLIRLLCSVVEESGKTLVASIHSVTLTRRYFSRALGLRQGELQFDLPVAELTDEILSGLYDLQGNQDSREA